MDKSATAAIEPSRKLQLTNLAPVIFVLLWSTGFLATKYGTAYAEPFTYLAVRFVIAGGLLLGIAAALRAEWPRQPRKSAHIFMSGVLIHGLYLSGVFHAIHLGLPAGVTSLVVNLQPVLTAIFAQMVLKERVNQRQWLGLALGLIGVSLVIGEKLFLTGGVGASFPILAVVSAFIGLLGVSVGTVYQKRYCADMNIATGTIIQYVGGFSITGIAALLFETRVIDWSPTFIVAMTWQVLGLSIGAISLLMYLIRQNSTSRVSSLFYLVPPLTAIQAYILFNEQLGVVAIGGMALAVVGVLLVTRNGVRQ